MNKQYIKKGVAVVLSVLMTASLLVGCKKDTDQPQQTDPAETQQNGGEENQGSGEEEKKELKGTLVFAHFNNDEASVLAKAFEDKYPGVKVEVQITDRANDAYVTAVTSDIRAGNPPDVFAAEAADVKRLVNYEGGYEDLSAAPYNAEELKSKLLPYTIEIGRSDDGKIRALSHQGTPAAIGYKRSLARKHLGTDDPAEIAEMFSSKEKILETAKKLGDAGVNIFPTWQELMRIYLGAREKPWVVDGKLTIDDKIYEMIDLVKELRDNGYEGEMNAWDTQWYAAIEDEENFAWAIPTWGLRWIIIAGMDGEEDNPMATAGEWGLAHAPTPYYWGGTWYGIAQDSENKELAWEFIKFLTLDEEQCEAHARKTGDFTSNLAVIEKLSKDESFVHELIGQNPYEFYLPLLDKINPNLMTRYDGTIEDAFQEAMRSYLAGTLTKDEMLQQFKDKVRSDIHDIEVD